MFNKCSKLTPDNIELWVNKTWNGDYVWKIIHRTSIDSGIIMGTSNFSGRKAMVAKQAKEIADLIGCSVIVSDNIPSSH